MEKKDIARHLASWGWQVKVDNVGDTSAELSLPDREVSLLWSLRGLYRRETGKRTQKLGISPSISTIEFSKIYSDIGNRKASFAYMLTYRNSISREETDITIGQLQTLADEAVTWAKSHDLNTCLQKHAYSPRDRGTGPLLHLTSLVILGEVEKLKHYQTSFEKGDRLGFVPYITKDYIDRAYKQALAHKS